MVKVATPPRLCMDAPALLCEGVSEAKDTVGRGPVVWSVCLVGEDLQHVHSWVKTCVPAIRDRYVHTDMQKDNVVYLSIYLGLNLS